MSPEPFDAWLAAQRPAIDGALAAVLARAGAATKPLGEALTHAVLLGGKRLRPALAVAAGEALAPSAGSEPALMAGVAVELIHAYSLVHDDLPAMDDDALRRGQPTVHVAYGEATAILAGDGLLTLAFEHLASAPELEPLPALQRLQMLHTLGRAAGVAGMVGGQALDMASTGQHITEDTLSALHQGKTGALIRAALTLGALTTPEAAPAHLKALEAYGEALGLLFQVTDDLLDATGDTATLGKTAGADAALGKATYVSILGLAGAEDRADRLLEAGLEALSPLPQGDRLAAALHWVRNRRF
ncbi:MAG: farnesyl diphosphate synthase [Pseudomonadota bacterium]|nr:farnesyl diphosphate synthase [Pseudomonadota bacterium]